MMCTWAYKRKQRRNSHTLPQVGSQKTVSETDLHAGCHLARVLGNNISTAVPEQCYIEGNSGLSLNCNWGVIRPYVVLWNQITCHNYPRVKAFVSPYQLIAERSCLLWKGENPTLWLPLHLGWGFQDLKSGATLMRAISSQHIWELSLSTLWYRRGFGWHTTASTICIWTH